MKYKVGDKVRVRNDLNKSEEYDEWGVAGEVLQYRGQIVTIIDVEEENESRYVYNIKEDKEDWGWTESMFEDLITPDMNWEEYMKRG